MPRLKQQIGVRIAPEPFKALSRMAQKRGVSIYAFVEHVLTEVAIRHTWMPQTQEQLAESHKRLAAKLKEPKATKTKEQSHVEIDIQ